jgi:hypothetical protein
VPVIYLLIALVCSGNDCHVMQPNIPIEFHSADACAAYLIEAKKQGGSYECILDDSL